jgi:uncharacterized protein (DUF362 family)
MSESKLKMTTMERGLSARVAGFPYDEENLQKDLQNALDKVQWRSHIRSDMKVFVKPNLTLPFPKPGVTTSACIIEAVLNILKSRASTVYVGESDGGYGSFPADLALKNHSIADMCKRSGTEMLNLSKMDSTKVEEIVNGKKVSVRLPKALIAMDASASLPVMKVHAVTRVSLSLKNMWGCHPDNLRLLDHTDLSRRLVLIARKVKLRISIIDAIVALNRTGPLEGEPLPVGLVLVGDNPVASDSVACRLMGFDPSSVSHISEANKAGLGPCDPKEIDVINDLSAFQRRFSFEPSMINRLSALTFKSEFLNRLVFASPMTRPIYAIFGKRPRRSITKPGEEG